MADEDPGAALDLVETRPSRPGVPALDLFPPPEGVFARAPEVGDEVGLSSEWAVPWSDLMMVMFILFVVLFVYRAAEREVDGAFRPEPSAQASAALRPPLPDEVVYRRSLDALRLSSLEQAEVVLQADQSVKVSVHGPLLFELGRAELLPDTRAFLERLARVMAVTRGPIEVTGHTDNFPIHSERFPTNWELSAARAASVARHLIRHGPLDPGRVTIAGRSMYAPVVPNSSPTNKALNRRVEIVIAASETPAPIPEVAP